MKKINFILSLILLPFILFSNSFINVKENGNEKIFTVGNNNVFVKIKINKNNLISENYGVFSKYARNFKSSPFVFKTDGNFKINLMWTGWQAPTFVNNSENPVNLTKLNFVFEDYKKEEKKNGVKILKLKYRISKTYYRSIVLKISYKVFPEKFYIKKKISVSDEKRNLHFLRKIYPIYSNIFSENYSALKKGGYGQPIAITLKPSGGLFFGLEYPSSYNQIKKDKISVYQWIGEKIGKTPVESNWTVIGIIPNSEVKNFFFDYLNDIRVAKLRPYLLYNSWYDLRAPEMVKNKKNIMNEENTKRIIKLFNKNMTKKYGVHLDAFVLDDGLDVYRSDWQLSKSQFPNGLKPISDELKKTNTKLGIWFGPIGGYSHRDWRLNWMKEHGYETVGTQLCFGGKNYSKLFEKRVLDFIKEFGVGYYKWDGFQFSCSEKGHGHPIGIYSRRAILNKLIKIANETRKLNPEIFLNITSGTWLSPWWVKIGNQIWMQGGDYGYSNVPSISKRDSATTYRDLVLYEDFKKYDMWFPVSNLMTHGIIKGDLQKLGGEKEDIEKFTNNAVLYFARGISMYELYITPDLLTDDEWKAIILSYKWAIQNFDILTKSNEMIGGNPGKREAYGYIHYNKGEAIVAVRNPNIESQNIELKLLPEYHLDKELILEKIYPYHWISPELYKTGDSLSFNLDGYETAIYKIYPRKRSTYPLISNLIYQVFKEKGKSFEIIPLKKTGKVNIINKENIRYVKFNKKKIKNLNLIHLKTSDPLTNFNIQKSESEISININFNDSPYEPVLAILFDSDENKEVKASADLSINGEQLKTKEIKGKTHWKWIITNLNGLKNRVNMKIDKKGFKGKVSYWLIYKYANPFNLIKIKTKGNIKKNANLFSPFKNIFLKRIVKIGESEI